MIEQHSQIKSQRRTLFKRIYANRKKKFEKFKKFITVNMTIQKLKKCMTLKLF